MNPEMNEYEDVAEEELDAPMKRKRKLLKKAPNAPKRFKSAYIYFVTEQMEDVKKTLPNDTKVRTEHSSLLFVSVDI